MFKLCNLIAFVVLSAIVSDCVCNSDDEVTTSSSAPSNEELLHTYSTHLESTLTAERTERNSTREAIDLFQVTLVRKLTEYRLQMATHKNHSFGEFSNEKWVQCVDSKSNKIKYLEDEYSDSETPCVHAAQSAVNEKRQVIKQIIKEVRQWRKGYRYLTRLCKENNPHNKANTGACLVIYMKRDNYDNTIARLLEMLDIIQIDFRNQITNSLQYLDGCLQLAFSKYLSGIRSIKALLNKCYNRKIKNTVDIKSVNCPHYSKFNCVH